MALAAQYASTTATRMTNTSVETNTTRHGTETL